MIILKNTSWSKKFSIFLVSFLIIFFALSQAQAVKFPGSGIWNSSGNVGIGTTNPGAKLDVNGNINSPSLQIGSGSVWSKNWTGSVSVPPGNGTSNLKTAFIAVNPISYRIRLFVVGDTSTQTGAVFLVYNNKSYNANTNNWTAKLVSRAGSTSNEVNLVVNSTSGTVSVSHYHSTGTYTVGFMVQELQTSNQSSLDIFGADNNWVNDTGKLYYNSGNVGIGTISPVAKLDVSGSFQVGSAKITGLNGAGNAVVMSDNSGNLYNTALSTFVSANTLWSGTKNGNIWNGDSGGGNVGIGTTAPGAKLDVRGNLRIGGSSNENYLAFRGTSLDNQTPYTLSYIGERIYGGTEQSELLIFKGNDYAPSSGPDRIRLIAGELRFDTYNSATGYPTDLNAAAAYGTARMTILNNGNVGIGTTAPSTRTEVSGTLTVDALGQSANYYSEGIRLGAASNGYSIVTFGANPALSSGSQAHQWWIGKYGSDNGFNIWSYDAGGNVFHILSNGNVGIGTTNPTAKLDVNGLVKSTGLNVNGSGPYIFKNNNSSGYASLRIIANQTYGLELDSFGSNTSGAGTYYTGANGVALMNVNSAGLALGTSNTTRLLINSSGNIGVGTTNPGAKLDVNGYIRSTSGGIIYPNGITQSNAAKVTYGSFTVGGSSSSYYPVQFVNDIYNGNQASSNLVIFRSNVHENGSWYGTFNFEISFHPTDYGHFYGQIEKIIYETGQGSPYNDPVGNVMDGSGQGGGHDLIIWLKGGATYHFRNTDPTTGWTLTKGNSSGGNITDSSGVSLVPVTSQSTLIINAKNRFFTSAIGLGSNSLYITGSSRTQSLNISGFSGSAGTVMSDASGNLYTSAGSVGVGTGISGQTLRNNGTGWVATSNLYNNGTNVGIGTTNPVYKLDISSGNSPIRIGPNTSYGRSLLLGGWGSSSGEAWIRTSNGNLHLDSKNGSNLYLNHYVPGTVYIGGGGGNTYIYGAIISPEGTLRDNGGGWVRTYGSTGWYSQSHGGGWYMTDSSWIRNYGSKPLYITGNNTNSAVFMSGNVGIGTATPGAKLDVNGDISSGNILLGRSINENNIKFYGTTGDAPGAYNTSVIVNRLFTFNGKNSDHSELLLFQGNDVNTCGTPLPYGSCGDRIRLDTPGDIVFQTGGGARYYNPTVEGNTAMLIDSTGNVGINTVIPKVKLDVNGSFRSTSATVSGLGSGGNRFVMTDNNGTLYSAAGALLSGSGIANYITKWSGTSGLTDSIIYDNGTNTGIGTTAPNAKLDIYNGALANRTSVGNHYRSVLFSYLGGGQHTGTLKIVLPKLSNTMIDITIKGYDYTGIGAWEVHIGGYVYQTGWYANNNNVKIIGRAPFSKVRLGNNGSKPVILLGTTSTNWSYESVEVSDVITSYSHITGWGSGWSSSLITSESGITVQATPKIYTYIDTSGNVGIGTTNPGSYKLNISGGNLYDSGYIRADNGYNIDGHTVISGDINYWYGYGGKEMFRTSDAWLRLNQAGSFTNGTYSPKGIRADGGLASGAYSLVAGEVRAHIFRGGNSGYYTYPESISNLNKVRANNFLVDTSTSINDAALTINDVNRYVWTPANGWGEYWNTSNNQIMFYGSGSIRSWIDLDNGAAYFAGNVGVGTTAPTYKLQVNGDIYADGGRLRVAGTNGLYFQSYGSGWYMKDSTWIRTVNSGSYVRARFFYSDGEGQYLTGGSGTANYLTKWNGKYTQVNSQIYDNGTNVGIGTTALGAKLTVNGGLKTTLANYLNGYSVNTGNSSIIVGNSIGETYALTAGIPNVTQAGFSINKLSSYSYGASIQYATPVFVVNNTNVGIGISAPAYKLDVAGPVHATEFVYGSDRALKKNIQPLTNSLQKIQELQGVSFNWKKGGEAQVGLIAQDVQKVYPELVHGKSGDMGVQYGNLVAPLIEAVKTQQAEIKDLQARVKVLETKVAH